MYLKRHQLVIEDGDFLLNIRLAVMEEDTPFSTEKESGTEVRRGTQPLMEQSSVATPPSAVTSPGTALALFST